MSMGSTESYEREINYNLKYYESSLEPNLEMSISIQDQQRVFLAYRALFQGQNSQIRQPKAIRKILTSRSTKSTLVKSIGIEKVVSILKLLLEKGIFSSELKAKLAFPILYETSPEQDARREASDVGAAKEEAEALHEVEALDNTAAEGEGEEEKEEEEDHDKTFDVDYAAFPVNKYLSIEKANNISKQKDEETRQMSDINVPSLYPVQFPFKVQNLVLARAQKLLEESCYDFTQKHAPHLFVDKRWDCPEAIELNKWTFMMIKRHGKLPSGVFNKSTSEIEAILLAVNKLRHSAVHRLRISAKGILQMVDEAVKFTETLSDLPRASQLEELYQELKHKIKSQEMNKNFLETRLKDELDDIKRQREELAKREEKVIASMIIEDTDNMHFIGSLLEGMLPKIFDASDLDDEVDKLSQNELIDETKVNADIAYKEEEQGGEEEEEEEEEEEDLGEHKLPVEDMKNADLSVENEHTNNLGDTVKEISADNKITANLWQASHHPDSSFKSSPEKVIQVFGQTGTELQTTLPDESLVHSTRQDDNLIQEASNEQNKVGNGSDSELLPSTRERDSITGEGTTTDIIRNILKEESIAVPHCKKHGKKKKKKKLNDQPCTDCIAKENKFTSEVTKGLQIDLEAGILRDLIIRQVEESIKTKSSEQNLMNQNS